MKTLFLTAAALLMGSTALDAQTFDQLKQRFQEEQQGTITMRVVQKGAIVAFYSADDLQTASRLAAEHDWDAFNGMVAEHRIVTLHQPVSVYFVEEYNNLNIVQFRLKGSDKTYWTFLSCCQ
jgi:hypothetical protein